MTNPKPSVAIVGAGLTGLTLAHRCLEIGLPCVVFEKASEVGGTWRENVYPGIGLDTAASTYCLPFAEKYDWTWEHPDGAEVQSYLRQVARDFRIEEHIRFNTEVTSCRWVDGRWQILTADGTSTTTDLLVMATGFLRVPSIPTFEGRETFTGPQFHSAQWDTSYDPVGKRTAVIGTGSSGIQITRELAEMGCEVTQVIRTPQWIHTRPNREQSRVARWLFRRFPALGRRIHHGREARTQRTDPKLRKNGEWRRFPGPGRDAAIAAFRADLEAHVPDPELREKMTPPDLPGCKRIPLAPRYYEAIQRPNVTIVRGGVARIIENGLVDTHGDVHEFDAIVYATGFDSHAYFRPIQIIGTTGEELGQRWSKGSPQIYRNLMVPDYPNLFVMHGPYAAINNIPIPLTTQEMVDFVVLVAEHVARAGVGVAPTAEAADEYVRWVQDAMEGTIWAGSCDSWYKTESGDAILWPFGLEEHTTMLSRLDDDDLASVPACVGGFGEDLPIREAVPGRSETTA